MNEIAIQKSILNYLTLFSRKHNLYFFRAGSGAIKTAQGRYFKSGKPGCPDIVCCYKGQFIGLEVKTDKGRQSQSQKEAEFEIGASGGRYYVVRSVADVAEILAL